MLRKLWLNTILQYSNEAGERWYTFQIRCSYEKDVVFIATAVISRGIDS